MSENSTIEWTDSTWNAIRGCVKVSPGCKNCYSEAFAERFRGVAGHPYEQGFDPRLVPNMLDAPLHWRKPRRIFVNSMSDLFGEFVPFEYIAAVFGVMAACQQHTFQVLTKRAERMVEWFRCYPASEAASCVASSAVMHGASNVEGIRLHHEGGPWPLPNVWIGVSVEDRKYGLPRIEHLRRVPAAVRFLSIEPLLEELGKIDLTGIDWVVVGGESGLGARPMHPDWARSVRDQCIAANVPFFFKQHGHWYPEVDRDRDDPDWQKNYDTDERRRRILNLAGGYGFHGERVHLMVAKGKKRSGRELDGRTWDEMPVVKR